MYKLQHVTSAALVGIISSLFVCWLWNMSGRVDDGAGASFMASAALLVGVATLISIGFTVIVYLEGSVLRARINAAVDELREAQASHISDIHTYRVVYLNLALSAMKGLLEILIVSDADGADSCISQLRIAEIDMRLTATDADNLLHAVELAFKCAGTKFFEIEPVVWERSSILGDLAKKRVRDSYKVLKQRRLDKLSGK